MIKVSIITPVYNTEKYLHRCIESCLNQTLKEIEIILIDDCSTDNSRDTIKSYSKKYPEKIKYIFQPTNQRQGAARNRGMELARGEYLIFVDSDDWIELDMCEKLYNKAVETDADMVGSDYFYSWNDRNKRIHLALTEDMCGDMNKSKKSQYVNEYGLFWTRIYKRKFLEESGLKFPENIFYEDALFNFYSVLYARHIEHMDGCFYHYYQENQSTVRNRNNPHQYERINLAECIIRYAAEHSELEQYQDIIEYKYLRMQAENILYTCFGQFDKPEKNMMRKIAEAVSYRIKHLNKNNSFKSLPCEFRFYLAVNSISPSICILVHKYGLYEKINFVLRRLGVK